LPIAARAAPVEVYAATLSGSSELPSNASPGSGSVAVFYFGPALMDVHASFSGLTSGVTATIIHCCSTTVGTNTGVAMSMANFPLGVTAGTYDQTYDMTSSSSYSTSFFNMYGTADGARSALLTGMSNGTAYFNIHTSNFPGGEIRGNLMLDTIFTNSFD
jgi:hypothetical protein